MKKNIIYALAFVLALQVLSSCSKDNEDLTKPITGLGGDTWIAGPLDNWISTNFTTPFNIEVKYKWDRSEIAMNKDITPVMENKVIPVMEAVQKTWIVPYTAIKGEVFVKKYSHKQFVLVGSPEYNSNGTITLGTAEGGRKIVLFKLNDFDKNNKPEVRQMLHTIHHEFAHILNQNIAFTADYKRLTPSGYTAVWFNYSDATARSLGFITSYARAAPEEDFVEMLSTMLVEGKAGFDALVNSAGAGRPALLQKQAIVTSYMKNAFGIDVVDLQNRTQTAINTL